MCTGSFPESMALGSSCTGILSVMRPIPTIAPKFSHPSSLISKYFEDNFTLFRIYFDSVPQLPKYSGALAKLFRTTWEHIALHSAYLGASGSICKDQCGCSELLSCLVMTSKPFYIFLMHVWVWAKNAAVRVSQCAAENRQHVCPDGSYTQSTQTLRPISPILESTSRSTQTPL